MVSKVFESIRVLFVEAWGSEREVAWRMQWRGSQLYLFNRYTLTKVLSAEDAERFLAGVEFPHGGYRKIRYLGRQTEG